MWHKTAVIEIINKKQLNILTEHINWTIHQDYNKKDRNWFKRNVIKIITTKKNKKYMQTYSVIKSSKTHMIVRQIQMPKIETWFQLANISDVVST